jgi:hypothetical protein
MINPHCDWRIFTAFAPKTSQVLLNALVDLSLYRFYVSFWSLSQPLLSQTRNDAVPHPSKTRKHRFASPLISLISASFFSHSEILVSQVLTPLIKRYNEESDEPLTPQQKKTVSGARQVFTICQTLHPSQLLNHSFCSASVSGHCSAGRVSRFLPVVVVAVASVGHAGA